MAVERWGYAPPAPVGEMPGGASAPALPDYLLQQPGGMAPRESWGMSSGPAFDPSQYQVGLPSDWITKDVGAGKYEMFSPDGVSHGLGYKSINDTLMDYQRQNIIGSARESDGGWLSDYLMEQNREWDFNPVEGGGAVQQDPDTGEYYIVEGNGESGGSRRSISRYVNKTFGSQDEITAALEDMYSKAAKPNELFDFEVDYNGTPYKPGGGDLAKWEALGNILAGPEAGSGLGDIGYEELTLANGQKVLVPIGGTNYASSGSAYSPGASNQLDASARAWGLPRVYRGYMPTTDRTETIAGEQALYGSKPVFKDGKLVGYQVDTSVLDKKDVDAVNAQNDGGRNKHQATENSYAYNWNRRSSTTLNAVGRQYNIGWGNIAKPMDDTGNVFVGKDDVSRIPGWNNKGSTDYQNWAGGKGLLGNLFKVLDPILDKIVPMHNVVQKAMTGKSSTEEQMPYFQQWAGPILSMFFPAAGAVVMGADAISRDDDQGLLGAFLAGLAPLAGGAGGIGSTVTGQAANSATSQIVGNSIMGAGRSAITGGDPWRGALVGAVGAGINTGLNSSGLSSDNGFINGARNIGVGMATNKIVGKALGDDGKAASNVNTYAMPTTKESQSVRVSEPRKTRPVQIEKWGMK